MASAQAVQVPAGRPRTAALAADTGYYDQSHMTAEFRAVMGVPPSAYRAGRLPAPGHCPASRAEVHE